MIDKIDIENCNFKRKILTSLEWIIRRFLTPYMDQQGPGNLQDNSNDLNHT